MEQRILAFMKENGIAVFAEADRTNGAVHIEKLGDLESWDLFQQLVLYSDVETLCASTGRPFPFQDEYANVGKISDFDKKISTFRSVNLSTCMIVQSPNQIETLYDKAAAMMGAGQLWRNCLMRKIEIMH